MSIANVVLLLTKEYPYGNGEPFLESEIQVLASNYSQIVVVACETTKTTQNIRPLPHNVTAYQISSMSKKCQFFLDAICGLLFWKQASRLDPDAVTFRRKAFLCYFERKSRRVFNAVIKRGYLDQYANQKILLYSYWLFTTARVGMLIKERLGANILKAVTRTHRYDLYAERNSLGYLPERRLLLQSYDMIIPCSQNGAEYLIHRYPEFKGKIIASLLGTLDYKEGVRSADGFFRIFSCSRITAVKRVERIVNALSLIENRADVNADSIIWTHIGDGALGKKVKAAAAAKLKKCRAVFTGYIKNNDVLKQYSSSPVDLFINVSSSEGLPVSIMEAISFGIPVIATDVGGTGEIVQTDVNGFLMEEDFSDALLADLIIRVLKMKESSAYKMIRERTRKLWELNFNADLNYLAFCNAINKENTSYEG